MLQIFKYYLNIYTVINSKYLNFTFKWKVSELVFKYF